MGRLNYLLVLEDSIDIGVNVRGWLEESNYTFEIIFKKKVL